MKNQSGLLVLILIVFAFLAVGCSSTPGPEDIYMQYWEACSEGSFGDAVDYLSENAKESVMALGSCGFTHDAINTIEAESGNPPRTFSEDPEVSITDNQASIVWIDDQGNLAVVMLIKDDDTWVIEGATWSR
jgi:hypothetical protein